MSTIVFRGDSQPIAQVRTQTVGGTPTTGQVYTVTINRKDVSYTVLATDTTNTLIATGLKTALVASTIKEFAKITWTSSAAVITATGPATGEPFELTTSTTGSGSPTLVDAAVTAPLGLNHWDDPENWSLNRVPAGQCAPPVQNAATASSGGTLVDTTTYYWVITATNALGETLKSNQVSLVIASPNQTANLSWANVVGATGYKVYRSTTTDVYTPTALLATITSGSTLTYVDSGGSLSAGAVPGANTALGDDVYLTSCSTPIYWGIAALDYLKFNSLHKDATFTAPIGLPDYNVPGGYQEYLPLYLKCAPITVYYGENIGSGSSFVRIDKGTVNAVAWNIYQTGSPSVTGEPALWIQGANSSDTFVINKGYIGFGLATGTASQPSTIKTSSDEVTLYFGLGAVLSGTTITMGGGTVYAKTNLSLLTINAGAFHLEESATLGTFVGYGGTLFDKSNGTITALTLNSGCTYDRTEDLRSKTITDSTLRNGSKFKDPNKTITRTNPTFLDGTINHDAPSFIDLDIGNGANIQTS